MFKRILAKFKSQPVIPKDNEILLSKIDKHMNFILRDNLGDINKQITEKISIINENKEDTILHLRNLHKAKLMNANIPEREVQIMDGNRDNYIKRISHFVTTIDVPKNYLDTYDYCVAFSKDVEQLNREIQKNIFVLQHFFSNEVKDTNKALNNLEEQVIEIRVILEKNGIVYLKEIQKDIKLFVDNVIKIKDFKKQIIVENNDIASHNEKLDRLNERVKTITNGTDFRALETFKEEKEVAENEMKIVVSQLFGLFSTLDTALKKYYYMHPEKKIAKEYLDDLRLTILHDKNLEISNILKDIKISIENNEIDLKDKKKDNCIETINKLTPEYLIEKQSQILKLEDQKQRAQAKITHNSASLNLSEQQYWISATEDKIKYHKNNIDKLEKNITNITTENTNIIQQIQTDLEKIMDREVIVKDDLTENILSGNREFDAIN